MLEDARLLELEWLTELETKGTMPVTGVIPQQARLLYLYLLARGFAEDCSAPRNTTNDPTLYRQLEEKNRWMAIRNAAQGVGTLLAITHAGAVRRAELVQQLKSGRIKDPMELVWDGRHFQQDARIALMQASETEPLAVVYSDLNDVKAFNAISHDAGDDAIRQYLSTIADLCFERADAYRLSGGADEIAILLPKTVAVEAFEFARELVKALAREPVHELTLRAAVGVVVATSPETPKALRARAEAEQARAKRESKKDEARRPSVLAWGGEQLEVITV
jgi:diguanylate cyclase (GGDEF)-like protein